jgi:hypothetical protein
MGIHSHASEGGELVNFEDLWIPDREGMTARAPSLQNRTGRALPRPARSALPIYQLGLAPNTNQSLDHNRCHYHHH